MTHLERYTADHKALVAAAARATGLADLVALQLDDFRHPLVKRAVRGPVLPLNGMIIRDWDRDSKQTYAGVSFGIRPYRIEGLTFLRVIARSDDDAPYDGYDFFAVPRADYKRLFRIARRCKAESNPPGPAPVVAPETLDTLRRNTLEYLRPGNLADIQSFGGRAKRGLLLTGPPGNGKTSACRWVMQECGRRGLESKTVSPDDYRAARNSECPAAAVRELFRVDTAGVIFFDDFDQALRNRAHSDNPEDQSIFLSALDGIDVNRGVVYVFTTNLTTDRIDTAFLRPGRIDAILHFPRPNAALRRELIGRWAASIRESIPTDRAVSETDGMNFAEVEELKNLMVLRHSEKGTWDWDWALGQFRSNRRDVDTLVRDRFVGFTVPSRHSGVEFNTTVAGNGANG